MATSDFRPGMHVVCVDARWPWAGPKPLVRGKVYTVERVFISSGLGPDGPFPRAICIIVRETQNPCFPDGGFLGKRFRPLDDSRIEIFRRIAAAPELEAEVA